MSRETDIFVQNVCGKPLTGALCACTPACGACSSPRANCLWYPAHQHTGVLAPNKKLQAPSLWAAVPRENLLKQKTCLWLSPVQIGWTSVALPALRAQKNSALSLLNRAGSADFPGAPVTATRQVCKCIITIEREVASLI